jgi:RNA polymerase sigma-70 factor (ECF subfamily)
MRHRFAHRAPGSVPRRVGELSDEALIAGVAVGEPAAIDEFLRRFERRVFGAALAVTRDHGVAQEVAQDTFLRVWRHATTYDPLRGSVVSWLLRITHNLSVDALRVRRPVAIDPDSFHAVLDHRAEPAATGEPGNEVRAALRELPVDQARSVLMAGMYGYTAQQISEIDGVPLGTAKTRIRLGLDKLRAALADSPGASTRSLR